MVLINGTLGASGLLGMDTLVLLPDATGAVAAQRRYADRRFTRPAPIAGTAATTIAGDWVVCETGATGTGALPSGAVPPAATWCCCRAPRRSSTAPRSRPRRGTTTPCAINCRRPTSSR
ncbi:hypothetical protein [Nannocystis pusilla]|uniref:hypothetical protein n=1 Tax=Nannocystis pusilla TaxID=889268 RepID=UPI003B7BEDCE